MEISHIYPICFDIDVWKFGKLNIDVFSRLPLCPSLAPPVKDGRTIQVGDCALFKSSEGAPHFICLIRGLSSHKEENINFCVNKIYRPVELKPSKCIQQGTVPNEVFYSFHRHEVPATSLLHPCKVAFLPKEADPSWTSSFVCRRVFEPGSKHLQWFKDYVDGRQEEVDQLLYKTQMERLLLFLPGGPSSQPINGPTQKSQLKSNSDIVQTAISIPSQAKGEKRDREVPDSEPIKRVRSLKADNPDSGRYKLESILKLEILKITKKGALVDSVGVEKLVQLMQPNRVEKKLELVSRSMFAGVIAATENFECLSQFVQLKGLLVLDQWVQDIHKGKKGLECSPKNVDKSEKEFLSVLLCALEKLPVNLQALQMCNIGKSVKQLRTYGNSEIQKKAKSVVDMWKKRVEAEINGSGTKCGPKQAVSWTSKSHLPISSHGGNRQYGGPSEAAMKSSAQCSADKIASIKPLQIKKSAKLGSSSLGPTQVLPPPVLGKDGQPRSVVGSNPDLPPTTARDERSSSSSQSQENSQSSLGDHAKMAGFSGKEDARRSTAGSISRHKIPSGGSRPWRSIIGHPASAAPSESPQGAGSTKNSSLDRNLAPEKSSPSVLTCEKKLDPPSIEGSRKRLIVKIRTGRCSDSANVGPVEEPTLMYSGVPEKNDQSNSDSDSKESVDLKATSDVKTESWQSNDFKDILISSDEGDGSPVANLDGYGDGDNDANLAEKSIDVSQSLKNGLKLEKLCDACYSSVNALIESCVNTSISGGDDGNMNLLTSVAAGERSKFTSASPDESPWRTSNIRGNEAGLVDESGGGAPTVKLQYQSADVLHDSNEERNHISVIHQQAEGKNAPVSSDSKPALNLAPQINYRSDEVKVGSICPASSEGNLLLADGRKQMDRNDSKIEAANLKDSSLLVNGKVDDVAMCLEADSENNADVREAYQVDSYTQCEVDERQGCNSPTKEFPLKSADKLEGVNLEDEEIEDRVGKQSIGQGASNASSSEYRDDRMTCDLTDESRESESSATNAAVQTFHTNKKQKFDINESFSPDDDDGEIGDPSNLENPGISRMSNPLPFPGAVAKGPFVPHVDLVRSKREHGWKGSAATSAFQPDVPRKASTPDSSVDEPKRAVFDFDLNVAEERIVEDLAGCDLDLNREHEDGDVGRGSGCPISESNRGFDLNECPLVDEEIGPSSPAAARDIRQERRNSILLDLNADP